MLADALGRPLRLIITPGKAGDITVAPALLDGQEGRAVLADKAYDSKALRNLIEAMGAEAVIPSNRLRKVIIPHDAATYRHRNRIPGRKNRKKPVKHDKRRYKRRNRIEIMFGRLKDWRRVATRYDRFPIVFLSAIALAATVLFWL